MINENIEIKIPRYPKIIIDTLMANGFSAYIVGGCVRDQIIGKEPSDFDITTNAKPEDIKKIFKKTIDTGIKHGTISVLFYDEENKPCIFEVTTFRIDGEYKDHRHPEEVVWSDDLLEDLKRRDFTINAMAYNDYVGLVDKYGGIEDLQKGLIRAVGEPTTRFTEDALRMIRAVRFASKLGFTIEENTKNAITKLADTLANISKERIREEVTKILISNYPELIENVFTLGMSPYIAKGFERIKINNHIITSVVSMAYANILWNVEVIEAVNILKELKFDNNTINDVRQILTMRDYVAETHSLYKDNVLLLAKKMIMQIGYRLSYMFIVLYDNNESKEGNIENEANVCISLDKKYYLTNEFAISLYKNVKYCEDSKMPIFIKDLALDGNAIMQYGYSGKEVGTILNHLINEVHKDENKNNKKHLEEIIKRDYGR